jgi:hypothetical protein
MPPPPEPSVDKFCAIKHHVSWPALLTKRTPPPIDSEETFPTIWQSIRSRYDLSHRSTLLLRAEFPEILVP